MVHLTFEKLFDFFYAKVIFYKFSDYLYKKDKMEEEQNKIQMATPVTISMTPSIVNINDIEIKQGECFINSYRIAKNYQDIKIVEGLIIAVDNENGAKAMPHVWNKKDEVYFDVTNEKIWTGRAEMNETKGIKYFSVKFHKHTDFKNGDIFEFCKSTNENVIAITNILNKKENDNNSNY